MPRIHSPIIGKSAISSYYDVWNEQNIRYRTAQAFADWNAAVNWWKTRKTAKYNGISCIMPTVEAAANGRDALYLRSAQSITNNTIYTVFIAQHAIGKDKVFNMASWLDKISVAITNDGRPFGCHSFHNVNIRYRNTPQTTHVFNTDLNTMGTQGLGALVYRRRQVYYDYNLNVRRGTLGQTFAHSFGNLHYMVGCQKWAT